MPDNSRAINRVFTRKVIGDLIHFGKNDIFDYIVQRYIDDTKSKNHGELISEIYAHLGKQQRNEYYYINTLLNKLLCGIHSVNTTAAFSQVRIEHSVADFVMINGEGRVYEIKSDLDNFERLHDQLHDYFCAFNKVSVLASIHELNRIHNILSHMGNMGDSVGIYVLSEQNTIFNKERSREPKEFNDLLSHASIFKLMRKREYESVLLSYYGSLPEVEPVFFFKACLAQFEEIPIIEAQKMALKEIKKRSKIRICDFESIEPELKAVIYFSGLSDYLPELNQLLDAPYRR